MEIEILKKPSELSKAELVGIFKKATGFDFKKYCIDEFKITHGDFVPQTIISCSYTGYSMIISSQDYSIKVENSIAPISGKIDIIGITEVLLKNGIIKFN